MNASIVKQMRDEEADLVRKLKAVRDFLAAYGEVPQGAETERKSESTQRSQAPREKVDITGYGDYHRKSVALAMMCMTAEPGPVKTRELVQFIEAMGHEITGKDKINALGALLSRSSDIQSHGKRGWTLLDREKGLQIANEYGGVKEKEPTSENAVGSVAGTGSAPTQPVPWIRPQTVHG